MIKLPRASRRPWAVMMALGLLGAAVVVAVTSVPDPAAAVEPTPTTSIIRIRVGGDRQPDGSVAPLPGVTLAVYTNAANTSPVTPAEATVLAPGTAPCVADALGFCEIVVPNTDGPSGENYNKQFWVRQIDVPDDWEVNLALRTGSSGAAQSQMTPYSFRTPALVADQVYQSGTPAFMGGGDASSTNRLASVGIWQQSRNNPDLVGQCGLRVALLLDMSTSVRPVEAQMKSAADSLIDALSGTPSAVSIFGFGDDSPVSAAMANQVQPVGVSTETGAQAAKDHYADWEIGTNSATNWDAGLRAASQSLTDYDLAIVLTDGNPTVHGAGATVAGPRSFNRLAEVEDAVFSANALKSEGTRVIAIGVGEGVAEPSSGLNLAAISGPEQYNGSSNLLTADYYREADYTTAATLLSEIATETCQGRLTVVKQVVLPGGSIASGTVVAGPGWTINVDGDDVEATSETTTTNHTGAVVFDLESLATDPTSPVDLDIAEVPFPDYTMLPVDGQPGGPRAICRPVGRDTAPYTVVNDPDNPFGFTVEEVPPNGATTCTIYNEAPPGSTAVTVHKQWVVNGTPFPNGAQPNGLEADLELIAVPVAGGGEFEAENVVFDQQVAEYGTPDGTQILQTQDNVIVNETVEVGLTHCEPDPEQPATARSIDADGNPTDEVPLEADGNDVRLHTDADDNQITITNYIVCSSLLTLEKELIGGGPAAPEDWDLAAAPVEESALPGPAGPAGSETVIEQSVTPEAVYVLSESGGDPRYAQDDHRPIGEGGTLEYPTSSGSWECQTDEGILRTRLDEIDGIDGTVQVPWGEHVICKAVNRVATLHLAKAVVNDHGGTAVPEDWTITLTPQGDNLPPGLEPVTIDGSEAGSTVLLRPGAISLLIEAGPSHYAPAGLNCNPPEVVVGTLSVLLTEHQTAAAGVSCTLVNDDQLPTLTLVKSVDTDGLGSVAVPGDFFLTATPVDVADQAPVSGPGDPAAVGAVNQIGVLPGDYLLSETGPDGFEAGPWTCDGGGVVNGDQVTVPSLSDVTCAITNVALPAPPPSPDPPAGPSLPVTGADLLAPLAFASAMLLAGGGLLAVQRRHGRDGRSQE